jgi:hypothetical protein
MWKNLTDCMLLLLWLNSAGGDSDLRIVMLYAATKEEASQLSTPTIQAYDNTVYPVIISVYHHLHVGPRGRTSESSN